MKNKIIGRWGEKIAVNYLKNKNYKILQTNWQFKKGEIDIIAYKEKVIAIEVKTRLKKYPIQTIIKTKQLEKIRHTLENYCLKNQLSYQNSQLDLIIITRKNGPLFSLRHLVDI